MICQLMKRDPAWKVAVPAAMLTILPVLGTPSIHPLTALMMGAPLLCLAALARPQQRATLFEAALPVPARDLFLARFLSLVAVICFPLAVYAVIEPALWVTLLECAMLLCLLILLPLSARVPEFGCPTWMVGVAWTVGATVGGAGIYFLSPAIFLALCSITGVAIFLKTWAAITPSFQCAPREAVAQSALSSSRTMPVPVWWTFARQAGPWWILIYFPFIVWESIHGPWLYAGCLSIGIYSQCRLRTRWMESLPVPRRAFLLFALVPMVLPLLIGAAFSGAGNSRATMTHYRRSGTAEVDVPLEFWRHAPGGVPPVVPAPWGETYQPVPVTFLSYPLYNPYSGGPQNSTRFMDWQYWRAQQVLDASPLRQPRGRILYVAAIFALSLGVAWLLELCSWFRLARFSQKARERAAAALFGPLIFGLLICDIVFRGGGSFPISTALLREPLIRIAASLPENLAVVAAVAALPVLFMGWLLDRQFRESEQAAALSSPCP